MKATHYSFGATTYVDGVSQNTAQQNFTVGNELNISLSPQNSRTFVFPRLLFIKNGPTTTGFSIKCDCTGSWMGRGTETRTNSR